MLAQDLTLYSSQLVRIIDTFLLHRTKKCVRISEKFELLSLGINGC